MPSFVERALSGHAKVASFERTKDIEFEIKLTNGKLIKMVLVNEYNAAHRHAQDRAKDWYQAFRVRVCRVERDYGF